ncbi:MAG: CIA30 family protein, partial [Acidobacteriota bacterium]
AGVTGTWHGWSTLREIELLVAGGLTPVEAMAAATGNAARAIHVDDERGFIASGKLADLVLIDGRPDENINDIERTSRIWLGGKEIDRAMLAKAFTNDEATPLPTRPATALIDDFESTNGRTNLGTLRVNSTDGGHDHSKIMFTRVAREGSNHALAGIAHMGDKNRPEASVVLPLSLGSVEPVDASAFAGVEFDARGEGQYKIAIQRNDVRDYNNPEAEFKAGAAWTTVRIPFSSLKPPRGTGGPAWTGRDLLDISFGITRPPTEETWLELDNVHFYR